MSVLEVVAEGVSIEKLRAHEMEEARSLQQALVPAEALRGEGFQFASQFRPAQSVGGDFLDYFVLSDGTVGYFLGDVVGKGLPAALYAALSVGTLRGIHKTGQLPVRVMELLNRRLRMRHAPGRFCSVQYGVLDPATRMLRYVNAGLPFPLHLSKKGCRALEGGGIPAGMFADTAYATQAVQLQRGDAVLFFTDGLSEAHSPDGQEFGRVQIQSLCAQLRESTGEQILEAVFAALKELVGDLPQHDDIAVAVMKVF